MYNNDMCNRKISLIPPKARRFAAGLGLGLALCVSPAMAQDPQTMPPEAGIWFDDTGDGAVEIMPCGRYLLCGKIVWLKNPLNAKGQPLTDGYNPDPSMRTRPICGLPVLQNLQLMTNGTYDNGVVYDPKKGKQHEAQIRLIRADKLQLTGFALGRLFSKSFIWTRAPDNLPPCSATAPTQRDANTTNKKSGVAADATR